MQLAKRCFLCETALGSASLLRDFLETFSELWEAIDKLFRSLHNRSTLCRAVPDDFSPLSFMPDKLEDQHSLPPESLEPTI